MNLFLKYSPLLLHIIAFIIILIHLTRQPETVQDPNDFAGQPINVFRILVTFFIPISFLTNCLGIFFSKKANTYKKRRIIIVVFTITFLTFILQMALCALGFQSNIYQEWVNWIEIIACFALYPCILINFKHLRETEIGIKGGPCPRKEINLKIKPVQLLNYFSIFLQSVAFVFTIPIVVVRWSGFDYNRSVFVPAFITVGISLFTSVIGLWFSDYYYYIYISYSTFASLAMVITDLAFGSMCYYSGDENVTTAAGVWACLIPGVPCVLIAFILNVVLLKKTFRSPGHFDDTGMSLSSFSDAYLKA